MATDILANLEEENKRLKEMMGIGSTVTPTATGANAAALSTISDEDAQEAQGLLNQFMKGRLSSTPPTETFDDYFKRTVRPATEFLQDFTRGFLASGRGQQAITTREEQYERYKDYTTRQDKIRTMERMELNNKVQSAVQLLRMRETANTAAARMNTQKEIAEKKIGASQVSDIMKATLELQKIQLSEKTADEKIKLMEAQRGKIEKEFSKNPFLQMAAETVRNMGMDPLDPQVQSEHLFGIAEKAFEAVSRDPIASNAMMKGHRTQWTDGWGKVHFGWVGPQGLVEFDPAGGVKMLNESPKNFQTGELTDIRSRIDAVEGPQGMNTFISDLMTRDFKQLEEDTGLMVEFKNNLPKALSDRTLSESQRRLLSGLQNIVMATTKANEGGRPTDKDREYVARIVPSAAADPATMTSIIASMGSFTAAQAYKERLGIDPQELDISPAVEDQRQAYLKAFKEAKAGRPQMWNALRSLGPASAAKTLMLAAKKAGRKDLMQKIYEAFPNEEF